MGVRALPRKQYGPVVANQRLVSGGVYTDGDCDFRQLAQSEIFLRCVRQLRESMKFRRLA